MPRSTISAPSGTGPKPAGRSKGRPGRSTDGPTTGLGRDGLAHRVACVILGAVRDEDRQQPRTAGQGGSSLTASPTAIVPGDSVTPRTPISLSKSSTTRRRIAGSRTPLSGSIVIMTQRSIGALARIIAAPGRSPKTRVLPTQYVSRPAGPPA